MLIDSSCAMRPSSDLKGHERRSSSDAAAVTAPSKITNPSHSHLHSFHLTPCHALSCALPHRPLHKVQREHRTNRIHRMRRTYGSDCLKSEARRAAQTTLLSAAIATFASMAARRQRRSATIVLEAPGSRAASPQIHAFRASTKSSSCDSTSAETPYICNPFHNQYDMVP